MKRAFAALLLFVTLFSQSEAPMAQSTPRIPLAQIQSMFTTMRAKAPWNVDGPLLWAYFFFDPSSTKLSQAASELQSTGYKLVSIQEVPSRGTFRLHVEKVETHSPESLHTRNAEFYALAERLGIASYDGMDVGPPPK